MRLKSANQGRGHEHSWDEADAAMEKHTPASIFDTGVLFHCSIRFKAMQQPSHPVPSAVGCTTSMLMVLPAAGRFAFVELRTEELATTAMTLDKTELLGRPMNIGRPKGYVPGTSAPGGPCKTEGQQSP
jgi:hypothetical protein